MTTTEQPTSLDAGELNVLPRRFLRPLLWLALSRSDRSYGYELAESVRAFGLNIDLGGVYRELRSMEQHDLLVSEWEQSENGPERRIYMATAAGERECEAAIALLSQARDLLAQALGENDSR